MDAIKRIAVIGAGPTGIAFAKNLLAEHEFDCIDVYEQRENVGGIWNLSGNEQTKRIPIPQANPKYGQTHGYGDQSSLEFESPLYDYLETNIPKTLMAYSDAPFASELPLFPQHDQVLHYLEDYALPIRDRVRFSHQVTKLEPFGSSGPSNRSNWLLTVKNCASGESQTAIYDAVVVANGHYTVPHVPSILGLAEWNKRHPGVVIHSKAYRRPQDYTGQRVLVIGNSASGLDIAAQVAQHAQHPVYLASRSASQLAPSGKGPSWRKDVAEVEEFLPNSGERSVRTKDGEVLSGFDTVIFATGYFYSFPFIEGQASLQDTTSSSDSDSNESLTSGSSRVLADSSLHSNPLGNIITSGLRTHDVYKHFIHIEYPTLAFPVLNLKVIPFPLAENQAAVLARLWSGRLQLPSQEEMRKWEDDEEKRLVDAHRLRPAPSMRSADTIDAPDNANPTDAQSSTYEGGFHTLVFPEDAGQINGLYDWAESASERDGLENNGKGKLGTRWNEETVWLRSQFANIKAAYAKHGEQRFEVTSLDELGTEWEKGFQNWSSRTTDQEKRDLFQRAGVPGW